jgi:lipopolysaccharide/colanic/teichoic acid biosynthesis glycosyltransferase
MMKRLFDLASSLIGLFFLSPVFIIIAIVIKLDSKGAIFFRQTRIGLKGKDFKIFKFRTMTQDSESMGLKVTVGTDVRITSSGHFLRKFKLDELPQLINVLLGDMSLVGPRPEVPEYMNVYPKELRDKILSVRPGITDEASIEYVNESEILANSKDPQKAYIDEVMPEKARYYVKYVDDHTFLGDIWIILKTVRKLVKLS